MAGAMNPEGTTRRIWYSVAMSLDGFIAGPQGEYDWIPEEPGMDWGAFMARFDTALMGRHSWEMSRNAPGGGLPGLATCVVSRTLDPSAHPDLTIFGADLEARLAELRRSPGKDIWLFGGGVLFRSLLELGQVDVIEVGVVPVILGGGIPFLPGLDARQRLALTHTRQFPSGLMLLTYAVQRPGT